MSEIDLVKLQLLSEVPNGRKWEKIGMCSNSREVVITGKCKQGEGICPITKEKTDVDFGNCWKLDCKYNNPVL